MKWLIRTLILSLFLSALLAPLALLSWEFALGSSKDSTQATKHCVIKSRNMKAGMRDMINEYN